MAQMSDTLKQKLSATNVPNDVIGSLQIAMCAMTPDKSPSGAVYANAMELSFDEYGIEGIKMQILYMLLHGRLWQGEQAVKCKKTLNRWAKSKDDRKKATRK